MTRSKIFGSMLVACVANAACGDSKLSMNPVAPSAVVVDGSLKDESGGAISTAAGKGGGSSNSGPGNANTRGAENGDDRGGNKDDVRPPSVPSAPQAPTNTTPTTTSKIEIEGLVSAKVGTVITVNNQAINVPATAVIRHGDRRFTIADLQVGDRVHVKGTRTTTGSGTTATTKIDAVEVELQRRDDVDEDGEDGK